MIKENKAISLVSLVVIIAVMLLISSITISVSYDRFEINNLNKMLNDLEFLRDKVSNYYLRYDVLPLVRKQANEPIKYTYKALEFDSSTNDNENYYIIDLKAMDGMSLNYGLEGFYNPNTSDDVYIINEQSHNIYYPRGIEWDGEKYYSIADTTELTDIIPPSKPEMKIVSGEKNEEGVYTTEVTIEIIPGKDNVSGIEKTTYSINDAAEADISTLANNIVRISDNGSYNIKVISYDKNGNISEDIKIIEIKRVYNFSEHFEELEYIESTGTQYIDTGVIMSQEKEIQIGFKYNSIQGTNGVYDTALFGVGVSGDSSNFCSFYTTRDMFRGAMCIGINTKSIDLDYHVLKFNTNNDNSIILDDVNYGTFSKTLQNTRNLYIFRNNQSNLVTGAQANIYYCKIYDRGELIRDYIPCYRKSDNIVGLYDTVSGQFFTNQGTEEFIAGPKKVENESPKENQELEYIKSTGTQYIDTGYIPNSSTSIEMKFSNYSTANAGLYCARGSSGYTDNSYTAFLIGGTKLRVDYKTTQYSDLFTVNQDVIYTLKQNKNEIYIENNLIKTLDNVEYSSNYNMYLLASHQAGSNLDNFAKVKLYYCKIWDNETLVRDFIPYIDQNGEVCLYDKVEGKYYYNKGTGEFIAGPKKEENDILEEYQILEYIESTGTQYIDTNVIMSQDIEIQTGFQYTSIQNSNGINDTALFGVGVSGDRTRFACLMTIEGKFSLNLGSNVVKINLITTDTKYHTLNYNTYNGKNFILDGVNYFSYTSANFKNERNLYIFKNNQSNLITGAQAKIYYFNILDKETVIRNFIPCKDQNGVVCLYDKVEGKYYYNKGTGDFIAGPEAK